MSHTHLDSAFIQHQRERLEALRRKLLRGEERQLASELAQQEMHGNEPEEAEERAQESAQMEVAQAVDDVTDPQIAAIDRALQKIDDGTYGFSDVSGAPIPRARLDAVPEAVFTIEEQERLERQGS